MEYIATMFSFEWDTLQLCLSDSIDSFLWNALLFAASQHWTDDWLKPSRTWHKNAPTHNQANNLWAHHKTCYTSKQRKSNFKESEKETMKSFHFIHFVWPFRMTLQLISSVADHCTTVFWQLKLHDNQCELKLEQNANFNCFFLCRKITTNCLKFC